MLQQFDRKPFLNSLRKWLAEKKLDAILIHKRTNVHYFSGFRGTAGSLVVTVDAQLLFTDFRYVEQAALTAPDFTVIRSQGRPFEEAVRYVYEKGSRRIGFESDELNVDQYQVLVTVVGSDDVLSPVHLDSFRAVKTPAEISFIRRAAEIADQAFTELLPEISLGCTERQIAALLDHKMRCLGSERPAFETIVASGPRSALPHGRPTDKSLDEGDFVVIDFGAVYAGYHSDMTRTVCLGRPDAELKQAYDSVLAAQLKSLELIRAGAKAKDVDAAARAVLRERSLDEFFGHGLGHSVGLDIHEEPRFSPLAGDAILEAGMVLTVEPGVYLPGKGGIRIEDLVLVTDTGCDILGCQTTKDLIIIK